MMENRPDEGAVAATVRDITERIAETCAKCGRDPADVRLMAVTKTVEAARVNEAIARGCGCSGKTARRSCSKSTPSIPLGRNASILSATCRETKLRV